MISADQQQVLEQSPNWAILKDSEGFIEEGFPFNEGFPRGASPEGTTEYEIIFRTGERFRSIVDFSTQYRAEGLRWAIKQPSQTRSLNQFVVAAWCEVPNE